jgi:DNA-binding LacI/PurR family transcriptional regulator
MGDLTYAFDDPQASRFLSGVAAVCVEHRMGLTLIPVSGDPDDDVERVGEAAVDGFILWSALDEDPVREAALASGRPLAVHGGRPRTPLPAGAVVVTIDNQAAASAVAAVAIAGAMRPAVVSFPLHPGQSAGIQCGVDVDAVSICNTRERLLGFRAAAERAGVRWAHVPVAVVARNDRVRSRPLIDRLFAGGGADRPDAIVAMSDELALATLDVLVARGLHAPEDVAVSGWDDSPAAEAAGLTTVRQSLRDQGVRCARWVVGDVTAIGDPPAWDVVVRRSTRPSSGG